MWLVKMQLSLLHHCTEVNILTFCLVCWGPRQGDFLRFCSNNSSSDWQMSSTVEPSFLWDRAQNRTVIAQALQQLLKDNLLRQSLERSVRHLPSIHEKEQKMLKHNSVNWSVIVSLVAMLMCELICMDEPEKIRKRSRKPVVSWQTQTKKKACGFPVVHGSPRSPIGNCKAMAGGHNPQVWNPCAATNVWKCLNASFLWCLSLTLDE